MNMLDEQKNWKYKMMLIMLQRQNKQYIKYPSADSLAF